MIYLIQVDYKEVSLLKIGYAKDIKKRLSQYTTENPLFKLVDYREGDIKLEGLLHKLFKKYKFSKGKEWFYYDNFIIDNFHINIEKSSLIDNLLEKVKNKLEKTKSFYKKLKIYCEFKKRYPDINFKVDDLQVYIDILGINKCKELNCRDDLLYRELCRSGYFKEPENKDEFILKDFLDNYFMLLEFFMRR